MIGRLRTPLAQRSYGPPARVLTSLPALFTRALIGDDWVSYYVFWTQGPDGFVHWMFELAHIGYSIPMLLFSYLGENTPNVVARIVGLTCHCLNGLLLYRVLNQSTYTRPVAALTTALFLVTPFYAIRLTLNAAYDFFLVFYLLSYVLMNSTSRSLRWLAPISLLFSLSLETLLALDRFVCCSSAIPGNHGEGGSPG
jgi:multisubunit Na+/H+ antiporter MnhF subunit